uniref:Uncharacterized protein n=1 Tax=Moniliophthora roreri TaxID=221103 RepID=A0A0W0F6Q6_MONRR
MFGDAMIKWIRITAVEHYTA